MQTVEFLLCAALVAGIFVTKRATAHLDCPPGEFLNTTTGACELCVCDGEGNSSCQPQVGVACDCRAGQYLVSSSFSPSSPNLCSNCTACSPGTRVVDPAWCAQGDWRCVGLSSYGCLESIEYFNISTRTCVPCTVCTTDQSEAQSCSDINDAVCNWRCPFPEFQFYKLNRCILNCDKCPGGGKCSPGATDSCLCNPAHCYDPSDKYCQTSLCNTTPPPTRATGGDSSPASRGPELFPPWGIALIALSIFASMTLFSTCVLLLCYCSRNLGGRDGKRPDSTSSESGFLSAEFKDSRLVVNGDKTTPIPLLRDIFRKMNDDAQGNLLGANGHVFLSSGIVKAVNQPRDERGLKTLSIGGSPRTLGTAV